jgi:hypothetical protein
VDPEVTETAPCYVLMEFQLSREDRQ